MNNDNEANDANDDGEDFCVGLPETERQELLRQRRKAAREIQLLNQERERLLLERQQQLLLLEQRHELEKQAETRRLWQPVSTHGQSCTKARTVSKTSF